jgi:serine/threonine protein kinase
MKFRVTSVPIETSQAACSIAKIIQLIGPLSRKEDAKFTEEFDIAEALVEMGTITIGSLEEELAKAEAGQECLEFIRYLLTLDPEKRPTAKQALEHTWFRNTE